MFIVALAKIIVYSISVDGNIRQEPTNGSQAQKESGFLAGSKALNSLEKLITSTETYFHPSNSGVWSISVILFIPNPTITPLICLYLLF